MTGGGSGGHITPLLSLAQELKAQSPDCQIIYIGHKGDNFDTFEESSRNFDFTAFINAGKLRRYGTLRFHGLLHPDIFWKNLVDICRFPGSVMASVRILRKFKPQVVFSKGAYVALPVGIAARLLRIPIVTHDSDTVPGLANRIIGRWARLHATGMPKEFYDYPTDTTEYVGVPIDPRVQKVTPRLQSQYKKHFKLPVDSTVMLVSGGSSGSVQLNKLMTSIAPELLETNLSLRIVHIAGMENEKEVRQDYKRLPENFQKRVLLSGYTNDFYAAVGAADLVITRAGATTIAELAAAGKACIVVPSAHLTAGHQVKNARLLSQLDAAAVAPENVQPDELLVMISGLLNNDKRRFELARNLYSIAKPDASVDLARLLLNIAGG